MSVTRQPVGATADAAPIELYTIDNGRGLTAGILTYGGILASLRAPDRRGEVADIVLGFDDPAAYLAPHPYFGALIGRYANRIAGGRFELEGATHRLATNDGPNHLHGGPHGFDKVVWEAQARADGVVLTHTSADGDEGYPGRLQVSVAYSLSEAGELRLEYAASTDQATIVNLTNHSYFNLAGAGDVLGHQLWLGAGRYLPVDATLIPTGELRAVAGTPMDFTSPAAVGARLGADEEQLRRARGGYDHCWVLDGGGGALAHAARLLEPAGGRQLDLYTTQPAVQFYSGNFLDGSLVGRGGQAYAKHAGLCLETQHYPDSPNRPDFPTTVLRPGQSYQQTTVFRLSVEGAA